MRNILLVMTFFIFGAACNNQPEQKEPINEVGTDVESNVENTDKTDALKRKSILFFGDSLTAGFGLKEEESFPSLIQNRIDSLSLDYEVINAGLSGETTAGGLGRINWVLNRPIDIFVLELGANDMLRGLSLEETEKNLRDILNVVREKNPDVKLIVAGMEAPPNMGQDYMMRFKSIFSSIASEYEAGLIPFLLDGLQGKTGLDIGDGKHPNAQGQMIVRENVWQVLKDYL